jgi:NAD(P)-dependent dehydrogenase (short-subunit alcohol dehydrogenase family)
MNSVQSAVEEFKRQESDLHMLICNAGVTNPPATVRSAQGYDMTLATNVIGHHQLVQALIPVLRQTAQRSSSSNHKNDVRCVFVSSWCHNMHQPCGFDVDDPEWRKGIRMSIVPGFFFIFRPKGFAMEFVRYGHTKFLNILQAKKFHRLYGEQMDERGRGIVFTACDPGNNVSTLLRNRDRFTDLLYRFIAVPIFLYPASFGAISPLWACTAPETGILGGQYIAPWARIATPAAPTEDHSAQDRLFCWLEAQLKKHGCNHDA